MRNERFQEEWTEYTCSSGLKLVLIHKPQFCTSAFLMMTPFGSLDWYQDDASGKRSFYEPGTAHFLEHKLFESGQEDVMRTFSRFGANVNAYTSYDSTVYYFTTPAEEISAPLNLLLDFVQDLSITPASVEKEKPIILEEYATYQQDPDARLFLESMRSIYRTHPLRTDIVGTEQSIGRITEAGLREAYAKNYHPSNMTLIAVTPHPDEDLIEIAERNQSAKQFAPAVPMRRWITPEAPEVEREYDEFLMDIEQPKSAVIIKLLPDGQNAQTMVLYEWALRFALERQFTAVNPAYQKWIDEKRITPYFGYEVEYNRDFAFIYFEDTTDDPQKLREFVTEQFTCLQKHGISEAEIRQMKCRVIGAAVRSFDHPMDMAASWGRGILRSINQFDEVILIERLNSAVCLEILNKIGKLYISCIKLAPEQ